MKKIVLLAFATVLMMVSCTNRQKTPQFKENPDMEYRTLGSTGLRVGGQLGRKGARQLHLPRLD